MSKRKPILILIIAAVAWSRSWSPADRPALARSKEGNGYETPRQSYRSTSMPTAYMRRISHSMKTAISRKTVRLAADLCPRRDQADRRGEQDGSFSVTAETPSGEATVYKIVGFEKYPLQEGVADEIAKHSSAIDFSRIIEANANLADFGLDQPRATAKVTYTDDTSSIIRVGNDAAGGAGTYITFGSSNDVYLVNSTDVESLLYNVNQFISLSITDTMQDSENAQFSKATISGTAL